MKEIILEEGKKLYFASDNHLGAPTYKESREREVRFVHWLDTIKADAGARLSLGRPF